MLVSSTEPSLFHGLGQLSTKPEEWGADFLWWIKKDRTWGGVQRKEISDFIKSAQDGRLTKEVAQMRELGLAVLILEGKQTWIGDHLTVSDYCKMSRAQFNGLMMKAQSAGIAVLHSANQAETAASVTWVEQWSQKEDHSSLTSRPGAPKNTWGSVSNREYGIWVLTSLPGVGRELAARIWDEFDGLPIAWTVTEDDLCRVKGLGKVKAKRLSEMLHGLPLGVSPEPSQEAS